MNPQVEIITKAEIVDRNSWKDFVNNHPMGNIFQLPEYYDTLKSQSNIKPISIFVIDANNQINGVMIGELLFENKLYSSFTKRAIFRGGPIVKNNSESLLRLILDKYKKKYESSVIYSEFRPVGSIDILSDSEYKELLHEKRLNILFDLKKDIDALFGQVHSSRRKQIRRGYKRGLVLKCIEPDNTDLIRSCYDILLNLYNKIKLPVPSLTFFLSASKCLSEYLKIFAVTFEQEVVGFRLVLCYKELIYDWFAASREEHYDKYPNDILPWEVVKWGALNNYKYFDFGGAGKPDEDYGVRDYKVKFGGQLIETNRYKIIHKPMLMTVGTLGYKVLSNIKVK